MGLKAIPSVVQLPGGYVLKGLAFKVVGYYDDGAPKLFELLPKGVAGDPKSDASFVLYADESQVRKANPSKAKT